MKYFYGFETFIENVTQRNIVKKCYKPRKRYKRKGKKKYFINAMATFEGKKNKKERKEEKG